MPLVEDLPKLGGSDDEIRSIRAQAYDLVLNGFEAGGGTIRIHDSEVQNKGCGLLGMTREQAKEQFGFLVDALQFGALEAFVMDEEQFDDLTMLCAEYRGKVQG